MRLYVRLCLFGVFFPKSETDFIQRTSIQKFAPVVAKFLKLPLLHINSKNVQTDTPTNRHTQTETQTNRHTYKQTKGETNR